VTWQNGDSKEPRVILLASTLQSVLATELLRPNAQVDQTIDLRRRLRLRVVTRQRRCQGQYRQDR
jgi:hypothetical protein